MDSTLQKILEAFKISHSKRKSFERESFKNIFVERKDYESEHSPKGKTKTLTKYTTSTDGSSEGSRFRKNGVPDRFHPRSQSLETQGFEKNLTNESIGRLSLRRNSSLDSETERFCMRYDESERPGKEQDNARNRFDDRDNEIDYTCHDDFSEKEEVCRPMFDAYDRKSFLASSNTNSCLVDTYRNAVDTEKEMPKSKIAARSLKETSRTTKDQDAGEIRCKGDVKKMRSAFSSYESDTAMKEDYSHDDISGYERWINSNAFTGQNESMRELEAISYSEPEVLVCGEGEIENASVVSECFPVDLIPTATETSSHREFPLKERSTKRQTNRLCRQEGMDIETTHCKYSPPHNGCSRHLDDTAALLNYTGNATSTQKSFCNKHFNRLEITVSSPLHERDEYKFSHSLQTSKKSGLLETDFQHTDWNEEDLMTSPIGYTSLHTGTEFPFMPSNAAGKSMKLRRDSPFAFPLIEEFARNGKKMPEGCGKKQVKRPLYKNKFSGSVGCFLQSHQMGPMSFGNNAMRITK